MIRDHLVLLKEALGGKKQFIVDDEVKMCKDIWTSNNEFFWKEHNEAARAMATVYRGLGRICRKIGITFWKKKSDL
jgi:hypothetical protein